MPMEDLESVCEYVQNYHRLSGYPATASDSTVVVECPAGYKGASVAGNCTINTCGAPVCVKETGSLVYLSSSDNEVVLPFSFFGRIPKHAAVAVSSPSSVFGAKVNTDGTFTLFVEPNVDLFTHHFPVVLKADFSLQATGQDSCNSFQEIDLGTVLVHIKPTLSSIAASSPLKVPAQMTPSAILHKSNLVYVHAAPFYGALITAKITPGGLSEHASHTFVNTTDDESGVSPVFQQGMCDMVHFNTSTLSIVELYVLVACPDFVQIFAMTASSSWVQSDNFHFDRTTWAHNPRQMRLAASDSYVVVADVGDSEFAPQGMRAFSWDSTTGLLSRLPPKALGDTHGLGAASHFGTGISITSAGLLLCVSQSANTVEVYDLTANMTDPLLRTISARDLRGAVLTPTESGWTDQLIVVEEQVVSVYNLHLAENNSLSHELSQELELPKRNKKGQIAQLPSGIAVSKSHLAIACDGCTEHDKSYVYTFERNTQGIWAQRRSVLAQSHAMCEAYGVYPALVQRTRDGGFQGARSFCERFGGTLMSAEWEQNELNNLVMSVLPRQTDSVFLGAFAKGLTEGTFSTVQGTDASYSNISLLSPPAKRGVKLFGVMAYSPEDGYNVTMANDKEAFGVCQLPCGHRVSITDGSMLVVASPPLNGTSHVTTQRMDSDPCSSRAFDAKNRCVSSILTGDGITALEQATLDLCWMGSHTAWDGTSCELCNQDTYASSPGVCTPCSPEATAPQCNTCPEYPTLFRGDLHKRIELQRSVKYNITCLSGFGSVIVQCQFGASAQFDYPAPVCIEIGFDGSQDLPSRTNTDDDDDVTTIKVAAGVPYSSETDLILSLNPPQSAAEYKLMCWNETSRVFDECPSLSDFKLDATTGVVSGTPAGRRLTEMSPTFRFAVKPRQTDDAFVEVPASFQFQIFPSLSSATEPLIATVGVNLTVPAAVMNVDKGELTYSLSSPQEHDSATIWFDEGSGNLTVHFAAAVANVFVDVVAKSSLGASFTLPRINFEVFDPLVVHTEACSGTDFQAFRGSNFNASELLHGGKPPRVFRMVPSNGNPSSSTLGLVPEAFGLSLSPNGTGDWDGTSPSSFQGVYTIDVLASDAAGNEVVVCSFTQSKTLSSTTVKTLASGVAVGVLFVLLAAVLLVLRWRQKNKPQDWDAIFDKIAQLSHSEDIKTPREIQRGNVTILEELGRGAFGFVAKAILRERGMPSALVAVKSLHEHASNSDMSELMQEAAVMAQMNHPNVVQLVGVVTVGAPAQVLLSYAEFGSLKSYLSLTDPPLALKLKFALESAQGLAHVHEKGFVHRDIAARNMMLSSDLTVQVGDFGLARDTEESEYYRATSGQIPVRWTAPEALEGSVFSEPTDVWSMGILCHEIWTQAALPYKGMSNREVWAKVTDGYRLPRAEGCSQVTYKLMLSMWAKDPTARPSFAIIAKSLSAIIEQEAPQATSNVYAIQESRRTALERSTSHSVTSLSTTSVSGPKTASPAARKGRFTSEVSSSSKKLTSVQSYQQRAASILSDFDSRYDTANPYLDLLSGTDGMGAEEGNAYIDLLPTDTQQERDGQAQGQGEPADQSNTYVNLFSGGNNGGPRPGELPPMAELAFMPSADDEQAPVPPTRSAGGKTNVQEYDGLISDDAGEELSTMEVQQEREYIQPGIGLAQL
eukprot:m.18780 g.18780  ORF g.18780 m.18780 type:complete len:1662 (-) comp7950_c0_seq1:195-5180(-)